MSTAPDDQLLLNAMYVGINIQDILYGVELVLYFKSVYALLNHPGKRTKTDVFYVLFSTAMLLTITLWISIQSIFGQRMWVLDPNFQGGPSAFMVINMWDWYMDLATMALIVLQLMTDGLMVYRCWVIWESSRSIIIPLILWTGTLVMGILSGWATIASRGIYLHVQVAQISFAYYILCVTLSAMLTCMICYRLLQYGKLMEEHLGREYASTYFAVVTLMVESVLPYTLSGIAFVISLGINSQTNVLFGCVNALMMCISPQMLILRVATKLWPDDANKKQPSTVHFSPLEGTGSECSKTSDGPRGFPRGNVSVV